MSYVYRTKAVQKSEGHNSHNNTPGQGGVGGRGCHNALRGGIVGERGAAGILGVTQLNDRLQGHARPESETRRCDGLNVQVGHTWCRGGGRGTRAVGVACCVRARRSSHV